MYAADHLPPHFHIRANDGTEALVEIASLAVLRGRVPASAAAEALAWGKANKVQLRAKWKELNP